MNVRASLARGALVTLAGVLALAADVAAVDIMTSFEGLSKTEVEAINHAVGSNPDPNLAVGPNHIFQIMNGAGRISDKSGRVISSFTLTSFFEMEYGRTGFDPRVIYDARSGRWFATYASSIGFTADGSPPPAAASVLLAVSNSSDPTAGFCQLRIGNPTTETDFKHDFPYIGVSDDKIVIFHNKIVNRRLRQIQL